MPKKPHVIRPTLHMEERRNVVRDRLLLARRGERAVCWAPAVDGEPAKLIFIENENEHVVHEGGRVGAALRDFPDQIATFLGLAREEVAAHLGLGRSVIWD